VVWHDAAAVADASIISKAKVLLAATMLLLLLLWFELQQRQQAHIIPQVEIAEAELLDSNSLKAAGAPKQTKHNSSADKQLLTQAL
jgi:hypothetical protein